ncbi:chemotaxis protein CheB [Caballeronia fortuita]|uniref:protein-glutamate methylesterase n=1 Tax=Caballeronia fortuita TaxID=1777138 RepID=A0A158EA13_9BURK|nr:chemotaxis protein CheB [Caballeronia fortuita]SAL03719.1 chemotaxis protein CheB [Caballeronia fortuita]
MHNRDIVVIAGSTGGFGPLKELLAALPADLQATVFVVMHIGTQTSILPEIFQGDCALPIRHAEDGQPFDTSAIYIAPPDRHLLIENGKTFLSSGAKENFSRPAADPLFRSAAVNYGSRVIGIVLSGELDDGAAGLYAVRACGGIALVQNPAECRAASMPQNAIDAVRDALIAPAAEIGQLISVLLAKAPADLASTDELIRHVADVETALAMRGTADPDELRAIATPSDLTCPECGGVLSKVNHYPPLRYRCHTGHAFSAATLHASQERRSEEALWSVLRGIQERISLARARLETASEEEGRTLSADIKRLSNAESIVMDLLKR